MGDWDYRPNTPRLECPECGMVVAIKYPEGAYCVDCERKLQPIFD